MNPTADGTPVYDDMVEAFIQRVNRARHTLGELRGSWRLVEKGNSMGIRMRVEVEDGRPLAVCSELYFLKRRRNGGHGIPKFCAQDIGVYTESMRAYDVVPHSRAGRASFAYTDPKDIILLRSMRG